MKLEALQTVLVIIAERVSARHCIAHSGQDRQQVLYVCMYVCMYFQSRFWNAISLTVNGKDRLLLAIQ